MRKFLLANGIWRSNSYSNKCDISIDLIQHKHKEMNKSEKDETNTQASAKQSQLPVNVSYYLFSSTQYSYLGY